MTVLRLTRFTIDPADTEEMLAKRAALIAAIRDAYPGLTEARLAKVGEDAWVDAWRWDSHTNMQAALDAAPSLPEAAAAFSVARDVTAEIADLVDER